MRRTMAEKPNGRGRGGRGAALLQMLNQQVRTPGDAQASGPQQSVGASGPVSQPGGAAFGGPSPPGEVRPGAPAPVAQQAASATAVPVSSAPRPPHVPATVTQAAVEPVPARGRGAKLQQLYDVQVAQQQQQYSPAPSSAPSEASLEAG